MYCQNCGNEVDDNATFCSHCGKTLADSKGTPDTAIDSDNLGDSTEQWNPKFPIGSVFASIMLFWGLFSYPGVIEFFIFGVPAVLVIPRVRRYIVPWVRERFNKDLSSRGAIIAVGVTYAILIGIVVMLMGGTAGNDPRVAGRPMSWLGVWLGMILIAFVIAVAIVTVIRINRKLRG